MEAEMRDVLEGLIQWAEQQAKYNDECGEEGVSHGLDMAAARIRGTLEGMPPDKPGFYWVRFSSEQWSIGWWNPNDSHNHVFWLSPGTRETDGIDVGTDLLTWGPRIEQPETLP